MNENTNKELLARIEELERQAEDLKRKNEDLENQLESSPSSTDGRGPGNHHINANDKGVAIKGSVKQSQIVTGSGNIMWNVYSGKPARDPDEAVSIYRRMLLYGCRHISLRGMDVR